MGSDIQNFINSNLAMLLSAGIEQTCKKTFPKAAKGISFHHFKDNVRHGYFPFADFLDFLHSLNHIPENIRPCCYNPSKTIHFQNVVHNDFQDFTWLKGPGVQNQNSYSCGKPPCKVQRTWFPVHKLVRHFCLSNSKHVLYEEPLVIRQQLYVHVVCLRSVNSCINVTDHLSFCVPAYINLFFVCNLFSLKLDPLLDPKKMHSSIFLIRICN